jgi:glycosyltransferase involved in cell wall biosynthesis
LWEGLPVALIEAIVSGVPAVVTDTGGVLDIVEDFSNGIIVKPRQVKKLSEAVTSILDNYTEWSRLITTYRKKLNLSYWSQERMMQQLNRIYAVS